MREIHLSEIPTDRPVLIAGPTASGKSALALQIAQEGGGVIVNADALQVFDVWQVLSARPSNEDLARARHVLYGHIPWRAPYSAGHWLRQVMALLSGDERVIIVGGTGLYFSALTQGFAEIPAIDPGVRARSEEILAVDGLAELVAGLDEETAARIDLRNPARVQRAWEVLRSTGASLTSWQRETRPPVLSLEETTPILLDAPPAWLTPRIERRFEQMVAAGALEEVRAMAHRFHPSLPSCKAIGAAELLAHLRGEISLDEACVLATIATRQFAKRQRTWFRARMKNWLRSDPTTAPHIFVKP